MFDSGSIGFGKRIQNRFGGAGIGDQGRHQLGPMVVDVVDPVTDYAALMETLFDFPAIREMFAGGFRMRMDSMCAVTGPYAVEILEHRLGAAKGTCVNATPLPDFGGLHPDPNPTWAHALMAEDAISSEEKEQLREKQLDALVARLSHLQGTPHILTGDFNSNAPSQQIDPMTFIDSQIRGLLAAGHGAHFIGFFIDPATPWAHLDIAGNEMSSLHQQLSGAGHALTYTFDTQKEETGIAELLRALAGQGIDFKDLQSSESSLEDIFVSLVHKNQEVRA